MAANPPKRDAWRPYDDIVFVLIPSIGRLKPHRGVIVELPHPSDRKGRALVFYRDDTYAESQWKFGRFRRNELILVPVDPNWSGAPPSLRRPRGAASPIAGG
ncbi:MULTISPECIES: hypothetical protein [Pimelobacter]|uniref:hypothetical protein n=1 Tax=Pimelobacter TaxID=2044 RepID=UPI001C040D3E|nr:MULTISPECIES: hypothetical protein [Pimelobacter]MBU2698847.1 hypothetical protein [Pimelobacter sp. 30-1]UUW93037.1 hypothetical protein M0M43_30555 [Pimelobacter simplex]UUW99069.1 hypothetical protein M0M48_30575 [Pimelobacter simplex]